MKMNWYESGAYFFSAYKNTIKQLSTDINIYIKI